MAASVLADMSLKHKIGQLVMSQPGRSQGEDPMPGEEVRRQLEEWGFGTWIIQNRGGEAANVARYTNQMQEWAPSTAVSPAHRCGHGERCRAAGAGRHRPPLPHGSGCHEGRRQQCRGRGDHRREAAAMGINWNFMPVADVNTNPAEWRNDFSAVSTANSAKLHYE
ncbi:hypothetical protein [Georgenia sp. SUBG003]|uniref:hypothetical protein n=1 Tax=Georgenia sp. SUBG003 TaxID=1497974 RepID=UPI003AB214F1